MKRRRLKLPSVSVPPPTLTSDSVPVPFCRAPLNVVLVPSLPTVSVATRSVGDDRGSVAEVDAGESCQAAVEVGQRADALIEAVEIERAEPAK